MQSIENEFYNLELDQIYKKLDTNPNKGLTEQEAQIRLEKYGTNEIPKVSKGFIKIYLAPLFNWLIVIYLIGALILFIVGLISEDSNMTMILITLAIVALNCIVAIVQQFRATKKLKALRELSAPTSTIIREGQKKNIPTKEIVIGDLLVLNQGDKIPADARIIESFNLEANEASLTGESEPIKKLEKGNALNEQDAPIGDRKNMVFYGTYITTGTGKSIVVDTGGDTEIGKISHGLEEAGTSEIPIREKMNNFGKWLGLMVFGMWVLILIIILLVRSEADIEAAGGLGAIIIESLNAALDLMPINIPLLTTIILVTGVLAMAHHGVIIRNLASVDSLGRVSVVCSDKTGTLTKNQMSVEHIWTNGSIYKVTGSGYKPDGEIILVDDQKDLKFVKHIDNFPQLKLLLIAGFLNNNSALIKNEVQVGSKIVYNWNVVGSPTEGALMVLYQKGMGDIVLDDYDQITEYPFDSTLKRMTKLYQKTGTYYSYTKGASEILMPLCSKIIYNDKEIPFTEEIRKKVFEIVNLYAHQGYRILSLSYKIMNEKPPEGESGRKNSESDMTFIGFVTILDPPRDGVKDSVIQCHEAGVDVVMITGDAPATARAIAAQISIVKDEKEIALEGKNVKNIKSFEELRKIKVFARVSPEHKQDIVEKYQNEKKVVAMTGDGVNDALALNLADAGIAMGIAGTDVAKEASDMVISDDSFNSIVTGIHQGRGIFAKIRAVVFFYIVINIFEGVVQFILAIILDRPYFLNDEFYLQWVFLSLLSISMVVVYYITISGIYPVFNENWNFGALNDAYLYSPVDRPWMPTDINGVPINVAGKTLTMLMVTLFFCESFLIFQIRRPNKSLIKSTREDSNKRMYLIIGLLFAIFLMLMYIPGAQVALASYNDPDPGINFMFMYLTGLDWLVCFLISLICVVSFEIVKFIARKKDITF